MTPDNLIDYENLLDEFSWIVQPEQQCILSPDSDGFLCGLLMSHFFDWKISGFYDGKLMILKTGLKPEHCIFLDMDINRKAIRSVGHHMVIYNKRLEPPNFNYQQCIQPNIMRNFDGKRDFQHKYPFGTIHLLIGLIQIHFQNHAPLDNLSNLAIWPLLFTDGVWNNLFGYTENCLEWISHLKIDQPNHILHPLFCGSGYSFYEIMRGLDDFLRLRDRYNAKGSYLNGSYNAGGRNKRTGDKLRISNNHGTPINLVPNQGRYSIHELEKERIEGFISEMGSYVEWEYSADNWQWDDFELTAFIKRDFSNSRLNNETYLQMMAFNPFSLAMTSGTNIEYTLEP